MYVKQLHICFSITAMINHRFRNPLLKLYTFICMCIHVCVRKAHPFLSLHSCFPVFYAKHFPLYFWTLSSEYSPMFISGMTHTETYTYTNKLQRLTHSYPHIQPSICPRSTRVELAFVCCHFFKHCTHFCCCDFPPIDSIKNEQCDTKSSAAYFFDDFQCHMGTVCARF